jgi:hypothetical protein
VNRKFIKNADIAWLLHELPELCEDVSTALITSVDSSIDLSAEPVILREIRDVAPQAESSGKGVALTGRDLLALNERGFFTGFDEIWLCRTEPQSPKPTGGLLACLDTSTELEELDLRVIEPWLRESQCFLGAGDGIGLSVVSDSSELLQRVTAAVA